MYCLFATSFIVLFHLQQELEPDPVKARSWKEKNLSVYAASIMNIMIDLVVIGPIALLVNYALLPALVACVLRAPIARVMARLDKANDTNRAVLHARAVFLRTIGGKSNAALAPTVIGDLAAAGSGTLSLFDSTNPLHSLGGDDDGAGDGLPVGWSVHAVHEQRRAYFFHAATETCQWTHPSPSPPLPDGWIQGAALTPSCAIVPFFYHPQTGLTRWARPTDDDEDEVVERLSSGQRDDSERRPPPPSTFEIERGEAPAAGGAGATRRPIIASRMAAFASEPSTRTLSNTDSRAMDSALL